MAPGRSGGRRPRRGGVPASARRRGPSGRHGAEVGHEARRSAGKRHERAALGLEEGGTRRRRSEQSRWQGRGTGSQADRGTEGDNGDAGCVVPARPRAEPVHRDFGSGGDGEGATAHDPGGAGGASEVAEGPAGHAACTIERRHQVAAARGPALGSTSHRPAVDLPARIHLFRDGGMRSTAQRSRVGGGAHDGARRWGPGAPSCRAPAATLLPARSLPSPRLPPGERGACRLGASCTGIVWGLTRRRPNAAALPAIPRGGSL